MRGDRILIFGGAGFIGTNLAQRFLAQGQPVRLFDALAHPVAHHNVRWLQRQHGARLEVQHADVRDAAAVRAALAGASAVFHFATRAAAVPGLGAPLPDLEVNVRGTLHVLEALRALERPPPLVFASTHRVYAALPPGELVEGPTRYEPREGALRTHGVPESAPLCFRGPNGCSRGAADQYVLDYAHSYGLPTCVFRLGCVYGPRQAGSEERGWVAHFLSSALEGEPLGVHGDGKQVRDVLDVEDLLRALLLALSHMDEVRGEAFNIGGGPRHTTSVLELLERIESLTGTRPPVSFRGWQGGGRRYHVSDIRRFQAVTGWTPRVGLDEGLARLDDWLETARRLEAARPAPAAWTAGAPGG